MHAWSRILACLVTLGVGCAPRSGWEAAPASASAESAVADEAPAPERFAGYYEAGWEREVFQPCATREEWWSWSTARIITEDARGWGRAFVVLEGRVSPRGRYGHLGRYPRQIVVTRVLEVRPAEDGACPAQV